jgi:predicted enzyme related to lactoylglutathione lyase
LFATGEKTICGMLNKPLLLARFWRYYFNTGAIDMASERVTADGGRIANGPSEVPGGQVDRLLYRSAGAVFALPGSPPTG